MKHTLTRAAIVSGILFIVIVVGNVVIVAQNAVTGTWAADTSQQFKKDGTPRDSDIQINFERQSSNGSGKNQFGHGMKFDELRGLTRDQAENGSVRFSLVREAGTIECQGSFSAGKGKGTFTFTPDKAFFEAMRTRGFDFSRSRDDSRTTFEDRALTAAFVNVTLSLADDLLSANFGSLDVDDLFKAAIFKIDGRFMAEMKATGFPDLKMEDLVKARIFKIDAEYVRQVHTMGFDNNDFEDLVKYRIFKITPEFLAEIKSAGLTDIDGESIVKCRIFNIDGDFIRKVRADDPNASIEDMISIKIGVARKKNVQ